MVNEMNTDYVELYAAPTWQCVMICWGTKYSTSLINNLARSIADKASSQPRFILISDRERPDLADRIELVRFPEYWLAPPLRTAGCHAKLAMFERGIVPTDLPAIYVDLDTIVLGDLSTGLALMKNRQTVAILPSAIIPFGWVGRTLHRWTNGRKYARGNSSFVIYHPGECHYIAERFRSVYAKYPKMELRPMVADERFISWSAQEHMVGIPASFAVKFPGEFMFYWGFWLYIKAWLPWVRTRRRKLVAVTLNGLMIKPEKLMSLKDGDVIVDEKARKLIWSPKTLGHMQSKIKAFCAGSLR
ncbi:hypothetical protein [Hydrogenophaga sp.]|uniref:hypothetical protein n=1 Tax=Hydrogenophaga sp. TaxID=1904254 RepID=UPI000A95933C